MERITYLNGFTCFRCGKGFYDGYQEIGGRHMTQPCQFCGHIMPAQIPARTLRDLIIARDAEGGTPKEQKRRETETAMLAALEETVAKCGHLFDCRVLREAIAKAKGD